jgi:hypothetical protein
MPDLIRATRYLAAALSAISVSISFARAADPKPAPPAAIPVAAGDPLSAIWGRGQRGLVNAAGEEGGEE